MAAHPRPAPGAPRRCAGAEEDRAVFLARREFELLKLVSTDRRALKALRLLRRPFGVPTWGEAPPMGAAPHVGEVPSPKGDGNRGQRRRRRRREADGEARREVRRDGGGAEAAVGGGGPPPREESSRPLNARGRRRYARAIARAENSARCSLAIACLVVMFVARVRTRAKAGKPNQGIGIGTVVVGEGGSPLRVSPKRSHSELEAGQGPSQLTPHHTGGACSLGPTYHYPFQPQSRPRVEDGIRSGSVVAVTSKASESTWYVHQYT